MNTAMMTSRISCSCRPQTVLCLAAVLVFAVPAARAQAAPATSPAQSQLNLQVNVPLVLEDVVVLDNKNQPIHNLKAADFTITEDGKPVTPRDFEEHTAVTAEQADAASRPPDLGVNVFTNTPTAPANSALNILLLDALNTPATDQVRVRQQMLLYLKTLPPGVRIAIFGLSTHLYLLQGFSSDPAVLKAALESRRSAVRSSALIPIQGEQASDDFSRIAFNASAEAVASDMHGFEQEVQTYQTTQRVQYTLEALGQLARYLSGLPGRKNLIWFSGSFPLYIFPDLSEVAPDNMGIADSTKLMATYGDDVRRTTDLMARSQVAVYPVDARGLFGNSIDTASQTGANTVLPIYSNPTGKPGDENLSSVATTNSAFLKQTATEDLTMDKVAAETGGKAFYNTGGLKEAVASVVSIGSNYYTVSYTPPLPQWDGKFRKIEVRLSQPGALLAYRKGYYADDPDADMRGKKVLPVGPMQVAMMRGGPDPSELLFKLRVTPGEAATDKLDEGGRPDPKRMKPPYFNYALDAVLDIRNVKMPLNTDGSHQGSIEFAAIVYDAEGNMVNSATRVGHLTLPAERYAQLLEHGLPFHQSIDVPQKGEYFLRFGVHDLTSDRVGAVEIPIAGLQSRQAMTAAAGQGVVH